LASYYHKFIKKFAKIATPFINLLKKSFEIYKEGDEMWLNIAPAPSWSPFP